jgi:peptidoglycan hydrolase-like protein with peptidoglycan-binding domain
MRIPDSVSRVLASSAFSMLLFSVTASRLEAGNLVRPAVSLNTAHFNPGIGAQARVSTMSPTVVHVQPTSPTVVHVQPTSPTVVHVQPTSPMAVHVQPTSPMAVHVQPASSTPITNATESSTLNNPINNNPILNPPGQRETSGPRTQSPAARNLSPSATVGTPGTTVETATRTAVAGYSVQQVRQVQSSLQRLGYYRGNVDGDFGQNTQNALQNYQVRTGVPVTGTLSEGVLSQLGVTARP